jgi:ribosomal protection tetracycline resistance protein
VFRRTLNLGIVAHVDAGKTTLTERLLYDAGVIGEIGSVDRGTTQTDSLALEQERGITIRSAVVSFASDNVVVNLVDTPGHPDFIAEVERVLGVLDGAVLVISAVEGVQPQTRLLLRALQRLRLPTLMFVNKVDRSGADCERVLAEIQRKLTPAAVAMTSARREGFRDAVVTAYTDDDSDFRVALLDVLAEQDDSLIADYVDDDRSVSPRRLRRELQAQTERVLVHPVFIGSAITGAGVAPLMRGIRELLPADAGDTEAPASGLVFKIERGSAGDRVAYLRMFSGTVHTRERVHFGRRGEGKVTAISVFADGTAVQSSSVAAGEIAKLWGLGDIQIGDSLGDAPGRSLPHEFPPPTLEAVVEPLHPGDRHRLHVALAQLAEQDPLINVRQDLTRQEIAISLYGEVQKEVIEATLGSDFGIGVAFSETIPIYIERPIGTAEARELLYARSNPFLAEIGLRVDPAPAGTGLDFRLQIDPRTAPLYLYHTREGFTLRMNEYVRGTLDEGLYGWKVTDCAITMTHCA